MTGIVANNDTSTPARGCFITFEGGEGAGKSTQMRLLADSIASMGIRAITTREPGGSPGAEIIRYLLLQGMGQLIGPEAEAMLFAAARDDHVHHVIEPALRQGVWVLCDRFTDSTRVYQGKLGKVDLKLIEALERVTLNGLKPDLTLILDVPAELGMERAKARRGDQPADRFESQGLDYHNALREAYQRLARDHPARCVLIDGVGSPGEVADRIWKAAREHLTALNPNGSPGGASPRSPQMTTSEKGAD
jgi:dTMP kinase